MTQADINVALVTTRRMTLGLTRHYANLTEDLQATHQRVSLLAAYIQGAGDVSVSMADNVKWFKVCVPDNVSTITLIQKFIAFVDKNPKYTLASTAFQLMLSDEFPCKK